MKEVRQNVQFTDEQLQERLSYWQEKLRLQDWIVTATIARARHMQLEGVQAEISHMIENKRAVIRLLDPVDWPEDSWDEQDMEWDIVHELLHLHFLMADDEELSTDVEQSIESVAYGLIALERKKR